MRFVLAVADRFIRNEAEMARAIGRVDAIDPHDCRHSVRTRYDAAITADGYEAVYRHAMGFGHLPIPPGRKRGNPARPHPLRKPALQQVP